MLAILVAVLAVLGGVSHAQQTPCTTIGDLVSSRPDLSLIQKAVSASGYDVFLDAPGPKTFFAPNDAAFQKLNEDAGSAVLDLDLLDLLRYHTFGGLQCSGLQCIAGLSKARLLVGFPARSLAR